MNCLCDKTATELSKLLAEREITSEELTRSVLDRIDAVEDEVLAFMTVTGEAALQKAREVDERRSAGEELSPIAGIPVAIKDNICTEGTLTTCSSRILENYIPIYNANVVELLNAADIIMPGKTNMDEFAMGSSTETSHFKITRNPWDTERVPGGSSGGSAASVACGESILAVGSDTGGSIRQPASFCGVVGLKPTYGQVSRYGLVAFASSLDQIGPLTKSVEDCALLLNHLAGHDTRDSTSIDMDVPDFTTFVGKDVSGLKIGVPSELMGEGLQEEVRDAINASLSILEKLGARVETMSLPHFEYALPAYYIIAPAEASSNLARFDGVRYGFKHEPSEDILEMYEKTRSEGFGDEVKRRIMLGTYALSAGYYEAYYGQALKVRTLILKDFEKAFECYDILVSPTSPTTSFKIGEKYDDPLKMYLSDVCTIPVNLAGIPAISIPCGLDLIGLPIGLQLMGKPFDEGTLLSAAYAFEQEFGFREKPSICP